MSIFAAALLALAPATPTVAVVGIGNRSCGAWTTATRTQSIERREFNGWLMGFLSAMNSTDKYKSIIVATDGFGYAAWVERYCAEHPLDTVYKASVSLLNELVARENREAG